MSQYNKPTKARRPEPKFPIRKATCMVQVDTPLLTIQRVPSGAVIQAGTRVQVNPVLPSALAAFLRVASASGGASFGGWISAADTDYNDPAVEDAPTEADQG